MKRKAKPVIAKPPKYFRQVLMMGRGSFWCPEIWNFSECTKSNAHNAEIDFSRNNSR
jgi:hypothetical protein